MTILLRTVTPRVMGRRKVRLKAGGKYPTKVVDVVNAASDMDTAVTAALGTLRGALKKLRRSGTCLDGATSATEEVAKKIQQAEDLLEELRPLLASLRDPSVLSSGDGNERMGQGP